MRYMCKVLMDPDITDRMTEAEWKAFGRETAEVDRQLMAEGRFVLASPLGDEVKTIRLRSGRTSVVDGPFAETKEQIAGFIIVEVDSMEEAVEIAKRSPFIGIGSVEVRQLTNYADEERS